MPNAKAALAALADPTRREIFERVAERPRAVGELARLLPVSRPAVSQHLSVLKAAGLVRERAEGTRRIYHIDPHGLGPLRAWLDRFWGETLESLKIEGERKDDGPHHPAPRAKKRRSSIDS
jgi:DNA-binding transcriptional ArsR family regulator